MLTTRKAESNVLMSKPVNENHSSNLNTGVMDQYDRRAKLKNSHIIVVCCGGDFSKKTAFRRMRNELELDLVVLEDPGNEFAAALEAEGICTFLRCSMKPRESLEADCIRVVSEYVKEVDRQFDGSVTFWDDAVALQCRIAKQLGLPHNSVKSVDISHDKYQSRMFLGSKGYNVPRCIVAESEVDVQRAKEELEFPVIIKPANAAASIGVRKVAKPEFIEKEYEICRQVLENALDSGDLMGIDFQKNLGTETNSRSIVIEEFLTGPEVDVDIVMDGQGNIVYSTVMDDWEFRAPWFCELGCNFPSTKPHQIQDQLREYAGGVVKDMGFRMGVFHVELILCERLGISLIEVNPRVGGGPVYNFHRAAFGVDLIEEALFSSIGLANSPLKPEEPFGSCVTMVAHAKRSGVLACSADDALTFTNGDSEVILAAGQSLQGQKVTGWDDGFPTSLARIDLVSTTKTVQESVEKCRAICDRFFENLKYE